MYLQYVNIVGIQKPWDSYLLLNESFMNKTLQTPQGFMLEASKPCIIMMQGSASFVSPLHTTGSCASLILRRSEVARSLSLPCLQATHAAQVFFALFRWGKELVTSAKNCTGGHTLRVVICYRYLPQHSSKPIVLLHDQDHICV